MDRVASWEKADLWRGKQRNTIVLSWKYLPFIWLHPVNFLTPTLMPVSLFNMCVCTGCIHMHAFVCVFIEAEIDVW